MDIRKNEVTSSIAALQEQTWNFDIFKKQFSVSIVNKSADGMEMEFDLKGLDCSFANTLRRVLLAEVPTIAIEKVYMYMNTSVIGDEMLAHRIGLIPLAIDPRAFSFPSEELPAEDDPAIMNPKEHFLFELKAHCKRTSSTQSKAKDQAGAKDDGIENGSIYSGNLTWKPLGQQMSKLRAPRPVDEQILLARLGPGQELEMRCLAVKGIGRDHAKFSPVATAAYRMHPRIKLHQQVEGERAERLKTCFRPGVIEIDPVSGCAHVVNERLDMNSREVLRHEDLANAVSMQLDTRHFIFSVESTGALAPETLVEEALLLLRTKFDHYYNLLVKEAVQSEDVSMDTSTKEEEEGLSQLCGRLCGLEAVQDEAGDSRHRTFVFTGEDHTLGNPLRYVIMRSKKVKFCAYNIPHPLEDKINFPIQSKREDAKVVLQEGLQCTRDVFDHMFKKFREAFAEFQSR